MPQLPLFQPPGGPLRGGSLFNLIYFLSMIVVTGGAGFIGSNLIKRLNDMGEDRIIVVDDLTKGEKARNLSTLNIYDFIDKSYFIENLNKFKNVGVVFHKGACTDTTEKNGRYMLENNYIYSRRLLEFCMERKVRFIYASSASVYGDGKKGFMEVRECEKPLNVYAYSKFLFDEYVRRVINSADIQIVGLRYFNVYGPQENHKGKMASVIYQFHWQIEREGRIKLFEGSDRFKRDFVYVKDVVDVNMFFYERENLSGIFNCGTGEAHSFLELANIMLKFYDGVNIEFIPFPEDLRGKYQEYTCANINKLRSVGYENKFTPLEEGIKEYVEILKSRGGYID